jgi:hypothetical protein
VSWPDEKRGHSVFTASLLEGLGGKAAGTDRKVTVTEIYDFVKKGVKKWTFANQKDLQTPVLAGTTERELIVAWCPARDVETVDIGEEGATGAKVPTLDHPWQNNLGMKFVPVPGTTCLFSIWETRVRDFEAFVKATNREWPKPAFQQGPTHPAVNVSWDDAQAFCRWLTEKERGEGKLQAGQVYRLPTDLEWSAAVGLAGESGSTPRERDEEVADAYPWGTEWPPPREAGNYGSSLNVDSYESTSPAGSFKANRYGLYDMGGNVWEWCEDLYDRQSRTRVLRGGSWFCSVSGGLLSSYRDGDAPDRRLDNHGFRCVLMASSR